MTETSGEFVAQCLAEYRAGLPGAVVLVEDAELEQEDHENEDSD